MGEKLRLPSARSAKENSQLRWRMTGDDFFPGNSRNPRDVFRDLERIKELRTLLDASRRRLRKLERYPYSDPSEIAEERSFVDRIRRQLLRQERRAVMSQFGMD